MSIWGALRQFKLSNLIYWDLGVALAAMCAVFWLTQGMCAEQLISVISPLLAVGAAVFAVEASVLAVIVSVLQKETLAKLAVENDDEPNLVVQLGVPFLVGAAAWVIGLVLLASALLCVGSGRVLLGRIVPSQAFLT